MSEWYGDQIADDELRTENKELRIMLALAYSGSGLYTDDGEFSCGKEHPSIDYKRMSVAEIKKCMKLRSDRWIASLSPEDIAKIQGLSR
jgi:hypothetical protein